MQHNFNEDDEQLGVQVERFAYGVHAGEQPRIADYLPAGGELRAKYFEELLHEELELNLTKFQRRLPRSRYAAYESEFAEVLDKVFQEFEEAHPAGALLDKVDAIPEAIDHYRIERELGRGGFGTVYLGFDTQIERHVAIKVLHATSDEFRLRDEARLLAQLTDGGSRAGILPIYQLTRKRIEPHQLYIVMPYVDGCDLEQFLERQPRQRLNAASAVPIFRDVCIAVANAHRERLIHCDIKPSNVLLDSDGNVYLTDFGLASPQNCYQGPLGTRHYMAPEQFTDHLPTPAMDIWALGVLLFRMLSGVHPFEGETKEAVERAVRERPAPLISQFGDQPVSDILECICSRCLEKDPSKRFATVNHLIQELDRWQERRLAVCPGLCELWAKVQDIDLHKDGIQGGLRHAFGSSLARALNCWNEHSDLQSFIAFLREDLSRTLSVRVPVCLYLPVVTADKLNAALDSFARVLQATKNEAPKLASRLEFHIISAQHAAAPVEWLESPSTEREQLQSEVFFTQGPDPSHNLIAAIANRFSVPDPSACAKANVQRLVEGAERDFDHAVEEVWHDLRREMAGQFNGIRVLDANDCPPTTVDEGLVITGEHPTLQHLREGYAVDQKRYKRLTKHAVSWLTGSDTQSEKKLPIFWIEGRSGDGKSVAMLFLLSKLHQLGFGPIQLLLNSDRGESLEAAIERSTRLSPRDGVPILAIDDPLLVADVESATNLWASAHRRILRERERSGRFLRLPRIIACGTREQCALLHAALSMELEFHMFKIDKPTREDLEETLAWLNQRLPARSNEQRERRRRLITQFGNRLFVQAMHEWVEDASMAEFAMRFQSRVKLTGDVVERWVSTILALNTHHIGFPARLYHEMSDSLDLKLEYVRLDPGQQPLPWVPRKHQDPWKDLNRDEHFGIAEEHANIGGAVFKDPNLAALIYDEWLKRLNSNTERDCEVAEHLLNGILATLDYGGTRAGERAAAIWGIARAIAASEATRKRVSTRVVQQLVRGVLEFRYAESPLEAWICPSLIELCMQAEVFTLAHELMDSLMERLHIAAADEDGLRRSCHSLIDHLPDVDAHRQQRIIAAIQQRLAAGLPDYDWTQVAQHVLRVAPGESLVEQCCHWMSNHPTGSEVPLLWLRAYHTGLLSRLLLEVLCKLLPLSSDSRWFTAIEQVLRQGAIDRANPVILEWVRQNHGSADAVFVLQYLLKRDILSWSEYGMRWLAIWHNHPCANFVIEPLLDHARHSTSTELLNYARSWAETRQGNASYVIEHLMNHGRTDRDLAIALDWIATNTDRPNWSWVYRTLLRAYGMRTEVVSVTRDVLLNKLDPASGIWVFTWRKLHQLHQHKSTVKAARKWLLAQEHHSGWPIVLKSLYESGSADEDVEARGFRWLKQNIGRHPHWRVVWDVLARHAVHQEKLSETGRDYLGRNFHQDDAWESVWLVTWQLTNHPDAEHTAARWLNQLGDAHRNRSKLCPALAQIWKLLCQRFPASETISRFASKWLANTANKDEFIRSDDVWIEIWNAQWSQFAPDGFTISLGKKWLKLRADHPQWPAVWQKIWERAEDNADMLDMGLAYLQDSQHASEDWPDVFLALRRRSKLRDKVYRRVPAWLAKNVHARRWHEVWISEWSRRPGDERLLELGMQYIESEQGTKVPATEVWKHIRTERPVHDPAIVNRLLAAIPADSELWTDAVLELMQHHQQSVMSAALRQLEALADDSEDWPRVWQRVMNLDPGSKSTQERGLAWLRRQMGIHEQWPAVWQTLRQCKGLTDRLFQEAVSWLRRASAADSQWFQVWQGADELHPSHPELVVRAVEWLSTNRTDSHWPNVWECTWKCVRDTNLLVELGIEWLSDRRNFGNPNWERAVWMPLVEFAPDNDELYRLGMTWLKEVKCSHVAWHYVWQVLWQAPQADGELLCEMAQRWLTDVEDTHHSWAKVWRDLWLQRRGPALLEIGFDWLDATSLSATYWEVWHPIYKYCRADDRSQVATNRLRDISLRSLAAGDYENARWFDIWTRLAVFAPEKAAELGHLWLCNTSPARREWVQVVERMGELQPAFDKGQFVLETLKALPYESPTWPAACERAALIAGASPSLVQSAWQWLKHNLGDCRQWESVWDTVVDSGQFVEQLVELATDWLESHREHAAWYGVWHKLLELRPNDPRTRKLALEWVEQLAPVSHASWHQVFRYVRQTQIDDRTYEIGLRWLRRTLDTHPYNYSWHLVWKVLWDSTWRTSPQRRNELADIGTTWLSTALLHHSWYYLWTTLWSLKEESRIQPLIALALNFLRSNLSPTRDDDNDASNEAVRSTDREWVECFEELWLFNPEHASREELCELAVRWLEKVKVSPPRHSRHWRDYNELMTQWSSIWELVWAFRAEDERLMDHIIRWLNTAPARVTPWTSIWRKAWKIERLRERLRPIGLRWLRECRNQIEEVRH